MLSLQRSSPNAPSFPWFAHPVGSAATGNSGTVPYWAPICSNASLNSPVAESEVSSGSNSSATSTNLPQSMLKISSAADRQKAFYNNHCSIDLPKKTRQRSRSELDLPRDPRSWMREDVQTWIRYMSDAHNLPSIDSDRFLMNGKALCLMSIDMFCQRVPLGGKMLYKDFQLRLSMAMYSDN